MLMPASRSSRTPDMWWLVPVPPEEKVSSPGLALAWAIKSATVLAGLSGFTTNMLETPLVTAIPTKSFNKTGAGGTIASAEAAHAAGAGLVVDDDVLAERLAE